MNPTLMARWWTTRPRAIRSNCGKEKKLDDKPVYRLKLTNKMAMSAFTF